MGATWGEADFGGPVPESAANDLERRMPLAYWLRRVRYKNATLEVEGEEYGPTALVIRIPVPDSRRADGTPARSGEPAIIKPLMFRVPVANVDWTEWQALEIIRSAVRDFVLHEADEWLVYAHPTKGDVLPFDPHSGGLFR